MHPLAQKIASIEHRLIWQRRAVAICRVLATALLAALLLGLIDYATRSPDPGLRIMATTALLFVVGSAAYRWWYVPTKQQLDLLTVSRRLESRFPQLNDALASAIEFLRQSEDDQSAGSAQLRRLVIANASNSIESLPLEAIIDGRPLRKASMWLGIAVLLTVLCCSMNFGAAQTALARLAAPFGTTQWPRQHQLQFLEVPTQVAAGQKFEVELIDTAGDLPDDVRIECRSTRTSGAEVTSEPMKRVGDMMVARRDNVRESFMFRAQGGDDNTMPWNHVEVQRLPDVHSMALTLHPPAYTGLPLSQAEGHLEVIAGTAIEVSGTTRQPIRSARILQDGCDPIDAAISTNLEQRNGSAFHIRPDQWIATKSVSYRLELAAENGLTGIAGQWNLRVNVDAPPTIVWQQPSEDLDVLSRALLPIELLAKDDLAIQRVRLIYDRTDKSNSEHTANPKESVIEIYHGPDKPSGLRAGKDRATGESRAVKYSLDLAPMNIPAGATLTIYAESTDYHAGTGRSVGPRRIRIIKPEELEKRLAERQLQIARQLERALGTQRRTRGDVERLQIAVRDAREILESDRNLIEAADANQRGVRKMIADPSEGVPPLVASILREIEMNRLENSELFETMNRLSAELQNLTAESLDISQRELTSARKIIETSQPGTRNSAHAVLRIQPQPAALLLRSLTAAHTGQASVIDTLERLISELSSKADYQHIVREVAELLETQIDHEKTFGREVGLETLPLAVSELSPRQKANLNKAAASETAIGDRFDKIEQNMDQVAQQLARDRDPTGNRLKDGVELSRRLSIGAAIKQSAADLGENRIAQALERESIIADSLKKVLAVLRQEDERGAQQLVNSLKDAEKELAALRKQLSELRQRIAKSEQQPPLDQQLSRQLSQDQKQTAKSIEELSRELQHLQAEDASKSTQTAANKLANSDKALQPIAERPAASNNVKNAETDLKRAADQLAARRQRAEDDLATEFVRRFQSELTKMVEHQNIVVKKTSELEADRSRSNSMPPDQIIKAVALADEERHLADLAKEHSEVLFGLGAVRVGLEDAERRLTSAAKLLNDHQTGATAQQAEKFALARLEAIMRAFAQTGSESLPQPNANNASQAASANNQPHQQQRKPTFELLEVKMLRMLQADLNERTRQYELQLAKDEVTPAINPNLSEEARELSSEQGRLAELVRQMIVRNNEKQEP